MIIFALLDPPILYYHYYQSNTAIQLVMPLLTNFTFPFLIRKKIKRFSCYPFEPSKNFSRILSLNSSQYWIYYFWIALLHTLKYMHNCSSIFLFIDISLRLHMYAIIIPILIRVYPRIRAGRIYPSSNLPNSHSPSRSIQVVLFLQAQALALPLHLRLPCLLHFLLPLTSNSNAFLRTRPSSLLNTCPYHFTPCAFAIWTAEHFLQS